MGEFAPRESPWPPPGYESLPPEEQERLAGKRRRQLRNLRQLRERQEGESVEPTEVAA